MNRTSITLLTIILSSFQSGAYGQAQSRGAARPAWGQQQKNHGDEYKSEKLSTIIDLPGVPQYTGRATFLSGLRYPNDQSGARIGMTLGCREEQTEILEWYKNALKTYSWNVVSVDPKEKVVVATKDGNTFTVRIAPTNSPGYRTLLVLSYKYGR